LGLLALRKILRYFSAVCLNAPNAQLTMLEDCRLVLNLSRVRVVMLTETVLSLVSIEQPQHGRIEQDANGNYFYIPNATTMVPTALALP
jgi:hypothetical protein